MAKKKNVAKIIESGTPKVRMMLLVEELATQKLGGKEQLTTDELYSLIDSFKSDYEMELYNKWSKIDKKVTMALNTLQGLKYKVLMHFSDLRGYILTLHTLEEAELLTNSILHELPEEERKRVAIKGSLSTGLTFGGVDVDKEGYVSFLTHDKKKSGKMEGGITLQYLIENVKEEAEKNAVKYLSWKKALEDYMNENGFKIKAYFRSLEKITEEIYSPVLGWNKYLSSEKHFLNKKNERLDKLKTFYNIAPDVEQLQVDTTLYNRFRKEHLAE